MVLRVLTVPAGTCITTGTHGYSRVLTGTHGHSRVLTGTHGHSRALMVRSCSGCASTGRRRRSCASASPRKSRRPHPAGSGTCGYVANTRCVLRRRQQCSRAQRDVNALDATACCMMQRRVVYCSASPACAALWHREYPVRSRTQRAWLQHIKAGAASAFALHQNRYVLVALFSYSFALVVRSIEWAPETLKP
jgi:hypothetical protein